ncbi:MAG: hypothetical protein ACTTHX_07050 [Moraxella sp.]
MTDTKDQNSTVTAVAKTVKNATTDYFSMLNQSIALFNKHRESVDKEIKNDGKLTKHKITL